jgi:6-phosphofructokinase 1
VPIGFHDGFDWLAQRYTDEQHELTIDEVSRVHLDGGVLLGSSRRDVTRDPESMENTGAALAKLKIDALVCIGGDDMVRSAGRRHRSAAGVVKVVQVPRSIDNDLWLPLPLQRWATNRRAMPASGIVKSLMEDARRPGRGTSRRDDGPPTGHLTLGIGKAVERDLHDHPRRIPEAPISLSGIADIVEGSIIKRRAMGKSYGVASFPEALVERFSPREVAELQDADRDAQGNIRVNGIDLGRNVKTAVQVRLEQRGIKVTSRRQDDRLRTSVRSADPARRRVRLAIWVRAVTYLVEGGSERS